MTRFSHHGQVYGSYDEQRNNTTIVDMGGPVAQRASLLLNQDGEPTTRDRELLDSLSGLSTGRYGDTTSTTGTIRQVVLYSPEPPQPPEEPQGNRQQRRQAHHQKGQRYHWLVYAGLCLLGITLLWSLGFTAWSLWTVNVEDQIAYGTHHINEQTLVLDINHNPTRTEVLDWIDPQTHHIQILVEPDGLTSKYRLYDGPEIIGASSHMILPLVADGENIVIKEQDGFNLNFHRNEQDLSLFGDGKGDFSFTAPGGEK